jgi:undecaprenyl-diphosphatase
LSILQAIIQGIVQGATEFLPVSSSGHLSLAQHFMGVKVDSLLFDVMLHIGTLLAVLIVYRELILRLIVALIRLVRDVFTGKFRWSHMSADRRLLLMLMIGLLPLFLLFVPVPGTGYQVKDFADLWATDSDIVVEGCALVATSILLTLGIFATKRQRGRAGAVSGRRSFGVPDALAVGFAQCVAAVFPGLSRSGSTLSAGLMRGISRQTALDYSFVIGIPAIVAAAALELKDALHEPVTIGIAAIFAGVIAAAIVGFLAIKLLRWMVASDKLVIFVWYTLILGIVTIAIGVFEHRTGQIITFFS